MLKKKLVIVQAMIFLPSIHRPWILTAYKSELCDKPCFWYHMYMIHKDGELLDAIIFGHETGVFNVADLEEKDEVEVQKKMVTPLDSSCSHKAHSTATSDSD